MMRARRGRHRRKALSRWALDCWLRIQTCWSPSAPVHYHPSLSYLRDEQELEARSKLVPLACTVLCMLGGIFWLVTSHHSRHALISQVNVMWTDLQASTQAVCIEREHLLQPSPLKLTEEWISVALPVGFLTWTWQPCSAFIPQISYHQQQRDYWSSLVSEHPAPPPPAAPACVGDVNTFYQNIALSLEGEDKATVAGSHLLALDAMVTWEATNVDYVRVGLGLYQTRGARQVDFVQASSVDVYHIVTRSTRSMAVVANSFDDGDEGESIAVPLRLAGPVPNDATHARLTVDLCNSDAQASRVSGSLKDDGAQHDLKSVFRARHRRSDLRRSINITSLMRYRLPSRIQPIITAEPLLFTGRDLLDGATTRGGSWQQIGIVWESNCHGAAPAVLVGTHPDSMGKAARVQIETVQVDELHVVHRAELVLPPAMRHAPPLLYRVSSGSTESALYPLPLPCGTSGSWHSPSTRGHWPCDSSDFVVAVLSDSQSSARLFRQHLAHISQRDRPVDMLLHLGDMVQDGLNTKEWRTYWTGPLEVGSLGQTTPILTVTGNHDGETAQAASYTSSPGPWYATTQAGARIIVLDSNLRGERDKARLQTRWLRQELSSGASGAATFRIVCLHVPPFTEFWEPEDWENSQKRWGEFLREEWVPLFEEFGVDLVLSGHSHIYQRGKRNGVTYTIIGGGGGDIDRDRVDNYGFYSTTIMQHHFALLSLPAVQQQEDISCSGTSNGVSDTNPARRDSEPDVAEISRAKRATIDDSIGLPVLPLESLARSQPSAGIRSAKNTKAVTPLVLSLRVFSLEHQLLDVLEIESTRKSKCALK